ncbi:tetratricopeptide repeat protein 21B isoform X2 [Sinocyclocheilus rhinocerous]|uniref:tetratricopeptide repeat protein 21B isoform X2 n=2 Tax=Sinocyclocheilus rhinocerous TaxID=307959 RepID=UPI0007B9C324|nr:PREDICTED: tetratricopeptide repeat protein 21B-like isoform X2 [Sinocyclocheilus rhinocerous]
MSENDKTCVPLIIYYMREKYYRHAINTAVKNLKLYNNDPVLRFFKAFATLMEGNTQEALREFIQLRDHPYLSLCSTAALIYAHKRSETIDLEAVNQLNWELKLSGSAAGDRALYYAALLYWILELELKARTCIKKMLKLSETSPEGLILKGWIALTSDTEENRPQAIRYFDSGVQDAGNLFGLMGKMEFFMAKQNELCALDIANQIIVSHPDFSPALLMKMKVFVSLRDWEQTEAVAQRVLERDGRDLKALQMMTVIAAAKDGNMELVKVRLQALMSAVEISEPCNPSLHVEITAAISRLCGHNPEILQMLTVFVRRVSSRTPVASDVICELGYLLNHQSKYKDAHKCYSTALKTEPKCTSALVGTIRCQLMCDQLEEAAQHLALFCEVQESLGNTAEVPLLKALLGRKQSAGEETVMQLLKDATELHFSALRGLNYGVEYLQMLDLNFLLQIVCMHLESKQDFALVPGQTPPFWLKHSNMILETVIKAVPGMSVSCYYMAYIKFLLGEHRTARHFLNLCIEKGPSVPEVHLLQARLHLSAGEHSRCLSCLESAVSVSFEVRDRFRFHLLKARALLRSGDLNNAIQCLKITMSMPRVRRPSEGPQFFISPSERVSVYLELTEALRLNGEQHEATRVLQDAILRFKGTPEETRLMLANVDLALARDDVDAAVVVLQNILPTESTYIQAREKMAHIYLERKHNEKLYITCYREISEQLPGAHTRILLADAFMKIHQPEEAVKIYREVEKIAPKDTLAKKIGQALVKAHEYDTAVSYYELALKTDTLDCLMSVELSELLLKLKRFEKAQQVLEKALEREPTAALATMMSEVTVLRVLVKVLRARNESALDVMKRLHDLQQKVVFRTANEHPEELEDQRKLLVVICCDWAREFHLRRNLEKAKQHYTDALNHSPDNEEVIFRLAQLYYEHQKLDYCEELCLKILQLHQNHTAALMLLADTLFWKNQKEEAVKIYAIIMEQNPDNFHAMAKFLHILRRMGKLDDVRSVFIACEKFSPLSVREPGYNYCKGLYFWHSCQLTDALMHLNKARGDADWGEPAVDLMDRICLNPDRDVFGGEVLHKGQKHTSSESESETRISTAHNILSMFRPRSKSEQDKLELLSNLCRISSKEPKEVERAVLELTDMQAKNVMLEASLLMMAQGFVQLKQIPRARNVLKRLSRIEWSDTNADDLESACLLLADMYIKTGKYTQVDKLLDSCIRHNQSCSKAYEYRGLIMESEQRHSDAALQYELAWKHSSRAHPAVGFRLAFNYLKCKNYTLAVDVCHQVLQQRPDYPEIQDELLTRAQLSLRL